MLSICPVKLDSDDFTVSDIRQKHTGFASGFSLGLRPELAIWLVRDRVRRHGYLPMQGVKPVRFIVVSSFVVTYVDGDRCVESREYMMRPCRQDRKTKRDKERKVSRERERKKICENFKKKRKKRKNFQSQPLYNKVESQSRLSSFV